MPKGLQHTKCLSSQLSRSCDLLNHCGSIVAGRVLLRLRKSLMETFAWEESQLFTAGQRAGGILNITATNARTKIATAARTKPSLEPPVRSALLDRAATFLSTMSSNANLADTAPGSSNFVSIQPVEDKHVHSDSDRDAEECGAPHVQMDIACGILDLHDKAAETAAAASLAENACLSASDTSSADDDDLVITPSVDEECQVHAQPRMASTCIKKPRRNDHVPPGSLGSESAFDQSMARPEVKSCAANRHEPSTSRIGTQPYNRARPHSTVTGESTARAVAAKQSGNVPNSLIEELPDSARQSERHDILGAGA
jgi:hypothetical protein